MRTDRATAQVFNRIACLTRTHNGFKLNFTEAITTASRTASAARYLAPCRDWKATAGTSRSLSFLSTPRYSF